MLPGIQKNGWWVFLLQISLPQLSHFYERGIFLWVPLLCCTVCPDVCVWRKQKHVYEHMRVVWFFSSVCSAVTVHNSKGFCLSREWVVVHFSVVVNLQRLQPADSLVWMRWWLKTTLRRGMILADCSNGTSFLGRTGSWFRSLVKEMSVRTGWYISAKLA